MDGFGLTCYCLGREMFWCCNVIISALAYVHSILRSTAARRVHSAYMAYRHDPQGKIYIGIFGAFGRRNWNAEVLKRDCYVCRWRLGMLWWLKRYSINSGRWANNVDVLFFSSYDQKGGGQRDAFSVASGFFKAEGTPAEVLIIERYWKI